MPELRPARGATERDAADNIRRELDIHILKHPRTNG
jgi:hypothetical protein